MMNYRVGHGYDVHRFIEGNSIVLGGVTIPHTHALQAHSDGDVLIHALMDALLGAAALGDIGQHFPDSDSRYFNHSSVQLLIQVMALLKEKGLQPANIDCTIIAQSPKMAPHISQMRSVLAEAVELPLDHINIKATTTEQLGFTGRGEGIAVHAVTLLKPIHE